MKILVGCEESQSVCIAFRKAGHEAYSCDLKPCSGGRPEWHLQMDVFEAINSQKWDMLIAFPDCTYLTCTANRAMKDDEQVPGRPRLQKRMKAIEFFMRLVNCGIDKIALENPVGVMSSYYRKPNQIIQPFQFGHTDSKKTCLWLFNLPLLKHTNITEPIYITSKSGKRHSVTHWKNPGKSELRSKTYQGIADAIADQWGREINP